MVDISPTKSILTLNVNGVKQQTHSGDYSALPIVSKLTTKLHPGREASLNSVVLLSIAVGPSIPVHLTSGLILHCSPVPNSNSCHSQLDPQASQCLHSSSCWLKLLVSSLAKWQDANQLAHQNWGWRQQPIHLGDLKTSSGEHQPIHPALQVQIYACQRTLVNQEKMTVSK